MFKCLILIYKYCVRFKPIVGEIKSVKDLMTVPWTETAFELFLHCLSHETFNWLAEKCLGDKKSKICLIKIAVAYALGEE